MLRPSMGERGAVRFLLHHVRRRPIGQRNPRPVRRVRLGSATASLAVELGEELAERQLETGQDRLA